MAIADVEAPASPDEFDVDPPYEAPDAGLPDDRFLDRELSWIAFNERVLELARDESLPLLERVRFLAIFASNLDEFFMVRIAGLKRRIAAGVAVPSASGFSPRDVLASSLAGSQALMEEHAAVFHTQILPALAEVDINLLHWDALTQSEQEAISQEYRERVFPVLTPLAVDPAHPFPYISGLSLNLALLMRNPDTGKDHFARVKVPPIINRWMEADPGRFVPIEEVMAAHLDLLFPGMEVIAHHTFRVTRNEDLEVEEDDAENLLKALEQELLRRKFGPPVRLEVEESIDPGVLELLVSELGIKEAEIVRLRGPLDLRSLNEIADLDRPKLQFDPFIPGTHTHLAEVETSSPADMFSALRKRDVLVHHPYDSFATSVQRFIEQAAADPHVLAIKQTLYRTSGDSPIIDSLVDAARAGKQVLVIVEIKARFDEQANIRWARKLERAGCHVVYGLVGLKTHCKLSLVVRDEPDGLRRYAHLGTGNYNPKTARLYEDFGLLTADPDIAHDLSDLFNNLSGFAKRFSYRKLHGRAAGSARRSARTHRPRDRQPQGRSPVRDPDQDQLDRRRDDHRQALRGVARRRQGRPRGPRHLHAAARRARAQREHPRTQHPRPFPRAQPRLLVRRRRRARGMDRLGRPDAPQPRPSRRGARTRPVRRAHSISWASCSSRASSDDTKSWHLGADGTWMCHAGVDLQTTLTDQARSRRSRA